VDWEQLIDQVRETSISKLPALLQEVIVACRVRGAFTDDGLLEFCKSADERAKNVAGRLTEFRGE